MPGKYTKEKRIKTIKKKYNISKEFEIEYDLIFEYLTNDEIKKYLPLLISMLNGCSENLFNRFQVYIKEFIKTGDKSITKRRMLLKYGEEIGTQKWNDYCNKQSVNGVKLEYFIEKYGQETGTMLYNDICKKKSLSKKNFIRKYGEEIGLKKYVQYWENKHIGFYSEMSQKLFREIEKILKEHNIDIDHIYYHSKNKEFGLMDDNRYYKYDFVDTINKVAIEFNGDYWHANPIKYKPDDLIRSTKAMNIWKKDHIKLELLRNNGYNVVIVWESEYNFNKNDLIKRVLNALYGIQ